MRAIDADALVEILTTAIRNMQGIAKFIGAEDDPEIKMEIKAYTDILEGVKEQSTIKPGHWERDGHHIKCSVCGIWMCDTDREGDAIPNSFCPNCGADMKGEQNAVN
jgi:rubrerythrin